MHTAFVLRSTARLLSQSQLQNFRAHTLNLTSFRVVAGPRRSRFATQALASFPSWKQRNQQLASSIKELLEGDQSSIRELKQRASQLSSGELGAEEFLRSFRALCGSEAEADSVLDDLTALLPTPDLQLALRTAVEKESRPAWDQATKGMAPRTRQQAAPAELPREAAGEGAGASGRPHPSADEQPQLASRDGDDAAAGSGSSELQGRAAGGGRAAAFSGSDPGHSLEPQGSDSTSSGPARKKQKQGKASGKGGGSGGGNALVWLRQDLRLHDNETLTGAAQFAKSGKGQLAIIYVHSPDEDGDTIKAGDSCNDLVAGTSWRPGGATRLWLHHALASLDADLQRCYGQGAAIIYRHGPTLPALLEVASALDSAAVFFSNRYEPAMKETDDAVAAGLQEAGLKVWRRATYLLREPEEVQLDMGKWGGHFGTLSPFDRACRKLGKLKKPLPTPSSLPVADTSPIKAAGGVALTDLGLAAMPRRSDGSIIDWGAPIREVWRMTEQDGISILDDFLNIGFHNYEVARQFADARAVSRLSPYIHFGQLSPRLVLEEANKKGGAKMSKTFMRRLIWRDLAYWQLHHWPAMPMRPIRSHYADQEWRQDAEMLRAWQEGRTGFPLVDAGMRQLWASGWMQQSVRMVTADFLCAHLNISWVQGAAWYHDTLVDADLAINSMMWQNAGKSGLDQWNFTLKPTSLAQDPDGNYVRTWVPELGKLPNKYIHEPWAAPAETLQKAGVTLGETYPHRIITTDLQVLKKQSTAAILKARRQNAKAHNDSGGYDLITVPEGATVGHDGQPMRVFTRKDYRDVGDAAQKLIEDYVTK